MIATLWIKWLLIFCFIRVAEYLIIHRQSLIFLWQWISAPVMYFVQKVGGHWAVVSPCRDGSPRGQRVLSRAAERLSDTTLHTDHFVLKSQVTFIEFRETGKSRSLSNTTRKFSVHHVWLDITEHFTPFPGLTPGERPTLPSLPRDLSKSRMANGQGMVNSYTPNKNQTETCNLCVQCFPYTSNDPWYINDTQQAL